MEWLKRQQRDIDVLKNDAAKANRDASDVELFSENRDRERDRLVRNFQEEHGASLRNAMIEVSRDRPDLFFKNVGKKRTRAAA